jgi:diguanylate cyclase (GGDEF)-like protein
MPLAFMQLAFVQLDLRRFTPRIFWMVMLAAALTLGAIVAIPQLLSKQARLQMLRAQVAEVARLAASVVDGDLHRQLLEPANHTPELYARALAPLVRFHSADPDIFYVYTMVERSGKTYFVLDTAASPHLVKRHELRASGYLEPFDNSDKEPDQDWLQRIAAGNTYVYPHFVLDEYGDFLSGHTPIYDGQGRYSGFVGVDFDLQYYLAREHTFRLITIGTLAASFLLALAFGYWAARYHYEQTHRMEQTYQLSIHDALTQLLNRRGALQAIRAALAAQAASYAAVLIDVDDLKGINDTLGHAAGDDFLVRVANAMRASVRDADICARLGGDEFLIFAAGCDLDAATEVARRLLSKAYAGEHGPLRSSGLSIGICVAGPAQADFEFMYRSADEALYSAKNSGKNRYVVFAPAAA